MHEGLLAQGPAPLSPPPPLPPLGPGEKRVPFVLLMPAGAFAERERERERERIGHRQGGHGADAAGFVG